MADVVTPKAFAERMDEDTLRKLQAQGLAISDSAAIDTIELAEPQYGETVLGTLTNEEAALFVSGWRAKETLEKLGRDLGATFLESLARATRENASQDKFHDMVQEGYDAEKVTRYFRAMREMDLYRNLYLHSLALRFGVWDYVLGIRSERRVVRGERKW